MTHLKRQQVPKNWPLNRKGTKFVVKGRLNLQSGVPLLIALRDMLKVAKTRKEVKKLLNLKSILVNNKIARDEKNSLTLLDNLTLVPSKKYYKLTLNEKGKFMFEEIKESESFVKIAKIIDKRVLKKKKIQINLSDGRNYLSDLKYNINDSVAINLKNKKIEKILLLKEGATALVFKGKHSGKKGKIKKINLEKKVVEIELNNDGKETIHVLLSFLIVIE